MTDKGLEALERLPRVERLSLQGNIYSDTGLAHLADLKNLKGLYVGVGEKHIADAGMAHLRGLTV
jgi:hypothetical protein